MESDQDQANRHYIQQRVHPIFEKLLMDLLVDKPDDVLEFMRKWLNNQSPLDPQLSTKQPVQLSTSSLHHQSSTPLSQHSQDSQQDDQEEEEYDQQLLQKAIQNRKLQRASVSAEAFGIYNVKQAFKPVVIQKSKEQKQKIRERIQKSFIFSTCDKDELEIVIDSMDIQEHVIGTEVISQGGEGDYFYVVDVGTLDCYRRPAKGAPRVHLKVYQPGESFGELALLYNAPRAATIIVKTHCVLFALDRNCFNNIVKEATIKKRNMFEEFLGKVDLLKNIDSYEKTSLCDALKSKELEAGEVVIRQGEEGDEFYLVQEGKCEARKVMQTGHPPIKVFSYAPGDYFGELALIKDQPRAATIVTTTNAKLLYIDRNSFKRLLGPIEQILKRNSEKYA